MVDATLAVRRAARGVGEVTRGMEMDEITREQVLEDRAVLERLIGESKQQAEAELIGLGYTPGSLSDAILLPAAKNKVSVRWSVTIGQIERGLGIRPDGKKRAPKKPCRGTVRHTLRSIHGARARANESQVLEKAKAQPKSKRHAAWIKRIQATPHLWRVQVLSQTSWLGELAEWELRSYLNLSSRASHKWVAWPTEGEIARAISQPDLPVSERTISRALKGLEDKGVLVRGKIEHLSPTMRKNLKITRSRGNYYVLSWPQRWYWDIVKGVPPELSDLIAGTPKLKGKR